MANENKESYPQMTQMDADVKKRRIYLQRRTDYSDFRTRR